MQKTLKIALIPAYEPAETLPKLAMRLNAAGYQVIIIDDGSGKAYEPVFQSASCWSTVITHDYNRGKGRALKSGLAYISKQYPEDAVIVTLDADGQHSVEDVINVCDKASFTNGGLVLGGRCFGRNVPIRSRLGNTITRLVFRLSTGNRIRDTQTGLRSFGSCLIPFMLSVDGERYEYEMNVLLECTHRNIPIREVGIDTIYFDNNAGSHFDTVTDSVRVYGKIIKFAASSFAGFLTDYAMYSLLILLTRGMDMAASIPLSNIGARAVSSVVNYTLNKRFVFQNKDSVIKTAVKYFALVLCILAGNTLLLSVLTGSLGINSFAAKLMTEALFFTVSWLVQKFLIFNKNNMNKAKHGGTAIHRMEKHRIGSETRIKGI